MYATQLARLLRRHDGQWSVTVGPHHERRHQRHSTRCGDVPNILSEAHRQR